MYRCHMCELETSQLNSLMSRHWKKHCNESYTKDQYKSDLLKHNGRALNNCLVCKLEVPIPKGEKESPKYHKQCYLSTIGGTNNPNYRGGKTEYQCRACFKTIHKHSTLVLVESPFCSVSCSMNFYAQPENRTDKQKLHDAKAIKIIKSQNGTDKQRKAHAESLGKLQKDRSSGIETEVLEKIRKLYPSAVHQFVKDFYTVDIYIPELDIYLDVHGNYWHNRPKHQSGNNRKRKFFKNKDLRYLELWGNETQTKDLVAWAQKPIEVTILCGPPGVGKSWAANQLSNQYNVIDYDKVGYQACVDRAISGSLIVTPIRATSILSALAEKDVRSRIIVIQEEAEIVAQRLLMRGGAFTDGVASRIARYNKIASSQAQFAGTQNEVIVYLNSQSA